VKAPPLPRLAREGAVLHGIPSQELAPISGERGGILSSAMPSYLSFRVELLEVRPPIWRAFLIEKAATFADLHQAIQDACGWRNCHMYAFREREKGPVMAGISDDTFGAADPDAKKVKVGSFLSKPGQSCSYQYDFGDDWWHEVTLVEIVTLKERFQRKLTDGARAFPPEDCGGIGGYEICVAIRKGGKVDLDAKETKERKKWLGDWRPERFAVKAEARDFDR
jgi:hypothetical protein